MTPAAGWDAETLWQSLVPVLPGISVEVLPEVASTNSLLLARTQDTAPCLLVAERQTQGRGRMGRGWVSAPGASLTFSLALPLAPRHWEGLSLAVGLALADALEPLPVGQSPRLQLKWPNDLWLCDSPAADSPAPARVGRKLGGVLIETAARGTHRLCVVGVGLNVRPLPDVAQGGDPALALNHGYASLHELHPGITAAQALARVALPLARALRQFEVAGFAPLVAAYARRDLLLGQAVNISGTPPLRGVAQGVDSDGALLIRSGAADMSETSETSEGSAASGSSSSGLRRVLSGEVSVRLAGSGVHGSDGLRALPPVAA